MIRQRRPVLEEIEHLFAGIRHVNVPGSERQRREWMIEAARLRNSEKQIWDEEDCVTRIYDIRSKLAPNVSTDKFCEHIETHLEPDSWDAWGGPGTNAVLELPHGTFFIVRQTEAMHRKIEAFFHEYESTGRLITVE